MAALINLDLSLAGAGPGDALGWNLDEVSTAESYAEFGPSALASASVDGFERGWGNDPAPEESEQAIFIVGDGQLGVVEGFEGGWKNDLRTDDINILPSTPALFEGDPTEGFETGWKGNEGAIHPPPGAAATFGVNFPSDTEGFDSEWPDDVEGPLGRVLPFELTVTVDFVDLGAVDQITRASGDFVADGVIAGSGLIVSGAGANDGEYTIRDVSATTITLIAADDVTPDTGVNATLSNFEPASFSFVVPGEPDGFEVGWPAMAAPF